MWQLYILVASLCLLCPVDSLGLSSAIQNILHKRQDDSGMGACEMNDPGCVNGYCDEDENGSAVCFCNYPYYGDLCDQVCPLELCWATYFDALFPEKRALHEVAMAGKQREPAVALRRQAMQRRTMSKVKSKRDMEAYEPMCREEFGNLMTCLQERLDNKSYCGTECHEFTVSWNMDMVADKVRQEEIFCSTTWKCADPVVQNCVDAANKLFFLADHNGLVPADNSTDLVEQVQTCVENIVSNELSFAGCMTNDWITDEATSYYIEVIHAEISGCDTKLVEMECKEDDIFETDVACQMTASEREHALETLTSCARTKAAAQGVPCDGVVDKLAPHLPKLLNKTVAECHKMADVQQAMDVCSVSDESGESASQSNASAESGEATNTMTAAETPARREKNTKALEALLPLLRRLLKEK